MEELDCHKCNVTFQVSLLIGDLWFHFLLNPGTPELGGQEGQLPPLPFAGRGKGGKSAL